MKKFRYTVITKEGTILEGKEEFESKEAMYLELKRRGLNVVEYEEVKEKKKIKLFKSLSELFSPDEIKAEDLFEFFYSLGIMLKSGVSFINSLMVIKRNSKKRSVKSLIDLILKSVKAGESLSSSLEKANKMYNFESFIPLIRAGERSGELSNTLLEISNNLDEKIKLKNEITTAFIYPLVLIVMSFFSVYIILVYVLPRFSVFIKNTSKGLPAFSSFLFSLSDFLVKNQTLFVLITTTILLIILFLLKDERFKKFSKNAMAKIPGIKTLIFESELLNFIEALKNMLKGGIPLLEAVEISSKNFSNDYIISQFDEVLRDLRRGNSFGSSLRKSDLLTPMVVSMIDVGEESGNLVNVLEEVKSYYLIKYREKVKKFLAVLEPLIIVLVGIIVAMILYAIYPVIMNLGEFK